MSLFNTIVHRSSCIVHRVSFIVCRASCVVRRVFLCRCTEAAIDTVVGINNQIKNGLLRMRPPKGGDVWPEHHFFINEHAMIVVDR